MIPSPALRVEDPVLPQLQLWLQVQVGYGPWPGNSICHRMAKKKKKSKLTEQSRMVIARDRRIREMRG